MNRFAKLLNKWICLGLDMEWKKLFVNPPNLDQKVWFREPNSEKFGVGIFLGFMPVKEGIKKYRPCFRNENNFVVAFEPHFEWKNF